MFSLLPLLILIVAMVGFFLGDAAATGLISAHLLGIVGRELAEAIEGLVKDARHSGMGGATVLSGVLLFFGASGIFSQLQTALNIIWRQEDAPIAKGLRAQALLYFERRVASFAMVLILGMILLGSFFVDTGLTFIRTHLYEVSAALGNVTLWEYVNLAGSFLLVMLMTAFIYQFLPQTDIPWSDVWIGAALTSALLALGRIGLAFYFRVNDVGSVYGVAESFVVILVGIYISAQIFLLGAEFTWVYSQLYGSKSRKARANARAAAETPEAPSSRSKGRAARV